MDLAPHLNGTADSRRGIFLMKGAMSEKYRDRIETNATVKLASALDVTKLTDEGLGAFQRLAAKAMPQHAGLPAAPCAP